VKGEFSTGAGRADIVWEYGKCTIIIEVKHIKKPPKPNDEDKKENKEADEKIIEKLDKLSRQALDQIKEKKYYVGLDKPHVKIILIGTAVDGEEKKLRALLKLLKASL
ncbi:MAG: PD-(D/E)XK nuclease domain-containing protein, partial [Elusimicrobiota bacterium]|nr:PD-(D/E)XK nuclease domain-containing protein [Elusimicrobiota bacterium]